MHRKIQFLYVQKKESLEDYLMIVKLDAIKNLNKSIYNALFNEYIESDENFNYIKSFYVKNGLIVEYTKEIWDMFISINYNDLDIIQIIDEKYLSSVYNSNILPIKYKKNKIEINKIMTKIFLENPN